MDWNTARALWADDQRAAGLAHRTVDGRDALLLTVERATGRGPLELTKADLVAVLNRPNARTGEPLSPGTKQVERSYLQTFTRWMLEEGYRDDDPGARLRKVKLPRRRPRPVTVQHIELMLDHGYQSTRDMIIVGALTGLRVSEIVKIQDNDVDHLTGTIRSTRKGGLEHLVHMPPAVREIADRRGGNGWWFPSPYRNHQFPDGGGHILMKSASTSISRCLRSAGIHAPITGHSLRHYYATTLLRSGVNVRVVQEMMGHASLATTQLYMEVSDEEMSAAANVLPFISPRQHSSRASLRRAA